MQKELGKDVESGKKRIAILNGQLRHSRRKGVHEAVYA